MQVRDVKNQKILIACLNWGKGHVARSIGLIQELLLQNNEIIIAGDEDQLEIFKQYFPEINCLKLAPYPFRFSGNGNFSKDLWKSRKGLLNAIYLEHKVVEDWVEEFNITLIISDHRYGFYSLKVPSIFVTHQLNLPILWWQKPVQFWHNKQLSKFAQLWIMDQQDSMLAGNLSINTRWKNCTYIGYYSRFMHLPKKEAKKGEVLICSGPKPYDEKLLLEFKDKAGVTIVCSKELQSKYSELNTVVSSNWTENDFIIMKSETIISYAGYSTLMDLHFLGAKSHLKATNGQAEQEYLLKHYLSK